MGAIAGMARSYRRALRLQATTVLRKIPLDLRHVRRG